MAKGTKKAVKANVTNPYLHSAVATVLAETMRQHVQMTPQEESDTAIHCANVLEHIFGTDLQRR